MRLVLLASILFAPSTARAGAPFPACAFEPAFSGFLVAEPGKLAPGCPIRWLEADPLPDGIRFELHAPDGQLIGEGADATPFEVQLPERRHECDGSVTETTRPLLEYSVTFQTAQLGDQVWLIDREGFAFATATYEGDTCTNLDFATAECQVCEPEASMGCADVSGGRSTGVLVFAALGAIVLRRRRR